MLSTEDLNISRTDSFIIFNNLILGVVGTYTYMKYLQMEITKNGIIENNLMN